MAKKAVADRFRFDKDTGVWIHPEHDGFAYSDGTRTEKRLLEILRNHTDLSVFSEQLRRQISSWPMEYHLSPCRHNLLRHLKFGGTSSILELGAGCGAITRQLGESGCEVWAVEGSPSRAACIAARNRDLANVRVFSSDFQAFVPERQFDIVTLIGVMEYAPLFFKVDEPNLECLKLARSFLKPEGTLILAIENQLGLKYFCGAPEDHTGKAFDGIQDRYSTKTARTFGRKELSRLLTDAGFGDIQFQYPFPDYKMPAWVFTEKAFETERFDPSLLLRQIPPAHMGKETSYPSDEREIWPVLQRNGLVQELSHSFLVLAGSSDAGETLTSPDLLATGYTLKRRMCFNTRTSFVLDEGGEVIVRKEHLTKDMPPADAQIEQVLSVEPYCKGDLLEQEIIRQLRLGEWDAAIAGLRRWMDYVVQAGLAAKDERDLFASRLKPEFFDCCPHNLVVAGESYRLIDLEWRFNGELTLRNHLLRYLSYFARNQEELLQGHLRRRQIPALCLAEQLGMTVSSQQYREFREFQRRVNQWIVGDKPAPVRKPLLKRLLGRADGK